MATGSPRPRVEWSRHQRSTLLSPWFFQEYGCLAVNTAKEYGEDYTCRATNSFGLTETVTTAIVTKLMGIAIISSILDLKHISSICFFSHYNWRGKCLAKVLEW